MTVPTQATSSSDPSQPAGPASHGPWASALDPADEHRRVSDQLLHGVIAASPRTMGFGMLAAVTLAAVATWGVDDPHGPALPPNPVWIWVALIALALAPGLQAALSRRKADPAKPLEATLTRRYIWGAHASAMSWGTAGWVLIPTADPWAAMVILVGMSMVLLGSAAAMAGCRPLVTRHVSLMALVFAAGLVSTRQPAYVACALGFVLLACTAIASAHRQEAALRSAIASQLRIASLLERLQREKSESDAARQDAIMAREEAEHAHAAKTLFMAAASHDLRQPLHAVTQYLAAISRLNADPRLQASIDGANGAVDAMSKLLQAVLEISKLMSGAVIPRPDVFALDDWVGRRLKPFVPLAAAKGLVLDVDAHHDVLVFTDRLLLDRVLASLLHNAISYTARGRVVVRVSRRGEWARIRVADSGRGIAPGERQRVFEPFYQVANPGRHRQHGLGLGLAIVREHVKLLGLQLRLTSRLGRGSVFTVTLPISPDRRRFARSPTATESAAPPWDHVADALIVLIDDDDLSLRATEATLVAFGSQVVIGHDADEAVRSLRDRGGCPQLILSDYRLEGATGLDAVAQVQHYCTSAFGLDRQAAVVILTGETSPSELAKVHASGALMLHKPVRPAVLFKHLNMALNQRQRTIRSAAPATLPSHGAARRGS